MQPWPCYVDQLRTIPYMDAMHAEWLREYAEDAESILEWGCGGSTIWLAQIAKGLVVSVEHDSQWRSRIDVVLHRLVEFLSLARWTVVLRAERDKYCQAPQFGAAEEEALGVPKLYDLAFIDGYAPWRLDCLAACVKCVKPGGHIFMHDSQRYPAELLQFATDHCSGTAWPLTGEQRIDSIGVGMWHAQLKG